VRHVGLDVHQKHTYFSEVDESGAMVEGRQGADSQLAALFSDGEHRRVALEAGRNLYHFVSPPFIP